MRDAFHLDSHSKYQPAFVGRESELSVFRNRLLGSTRGEGGLVLIAGEAGIGKTSLVQTVAAEAERTDALVLTGHCYDLTTTPPYGPWIEILRRYPADDSLPGVPDVLKRGTGMGDVMSQAGLFEVARDFLVSVSEVRPLMLVLEDIHWSDPASLGLLRSLSRHAGEHSMLIVATYRDDEITREHEMYKLLPSLTREANATRINLRPLGESAIRKLLEHHYQLNERDSTRLGAYLNQHSDGNPLYFWEILRALEYEDRLLAESGGWKLGDLSQIRVPSLLLQMIERRMERMSEEQRELLEVAAVIGQEISIDLWKTVSDSSDDALTGVIDYSLEAGLLVEWSPGASLVFAHALVREAIYQRTPMIRRRQLHLRIAEGLIDGPDSDEDAVAHHLQQAGDDRAADWLVRAGERAQRSYAMQTAGERFACAAELLRGKSSRLNDRGWCLYRAARQFRFSDPERGIACFEEAERIGNLVGDDALAAYALTDRGHLHGNTGNMRQNVEDVLAGNVAIEALPRDHFQSDSVRNWVADVVLSTPRTDPEDQRFMGRLGGSFNPRRALISLMHAMVGRLAESVEIGQPYREQIAAISNPDHHLLAPYADVCSSLGIAYSHLGMPDMASDAFEDARATLRKLDHRALLASTAYWTLQHVALPYRADRLNERERLAAEAEKAARDAHEALLTSSAKQLMNFHLLWIEGRWEEAREYAPLGLTTVFREHQSHTHIALGKIARATGEAEIAWEHVYNVLQDGLATDPIDVGLHAMLDARVLAASLALDMNDLDRAREWIDSIDRWLNWSGAVRGRAERALLWSRYYHLSGDPGQAIRYGEDALASASEPRQPLAVIESHRHLGQLKSAAGQFDSAAWHLEEALATSDRCNAPFETALTRLEFAGLRLLTGEPAVARSLLDAATHTFVALNAGPALKRAHILTERLRRRPAHHAGLTARELDVLRLVAQGLSDPEIAEQLYITRRTVNTHLTSIFRKLDVNSRTSAALVAREHDLV